MGLPSIDEIYSTADETRRATREFAGSVTVEESEVLADGEKWTLRALFEHMSIVDDTVLWVVEKLLAKARERGDDSKTQSAAVSDDFLAKVRSITANKLEAPASVQPTGEIPILDSIRRLEDTLLALIAHRDELSSTDLSRDRIPHPYLGELTAIEWMILRNGHESRHLDQARLILGKIRKNEKAGG